MTKKEHMVEFQIEDEDLIEKIEQLEKDGYSINAIITNYHDATRYGWENYIKEHPKLNSWFMMRGELLQMIENIDKKIDDYIDEIQ